MMVYRCAQESNGTKKDKQDFLSGDQAESFAKYEDPVAAQNLTSR